MITCVPIKTNKRMGEGRGRGACCSPAAGWLWAPWTWHEGASSSLADALCLWLAGMRKWGEHVTFFMNKRKHYFCSLINSIHLSAVKARWRKSISVLSGASNYLFSKCFWTLSTVLHIRQSNHRLQFSVGNILRLIANNKLRPFLPV